MVSPLFQVFSIDRLLSTPFNLAHTFAAALAVLFSPNSTTVYKLPSSLMIMPRLISAVLAINPVRFLNKSLIYTLAGRSQNKGGRQIYVKIGSWQRLTEKGETVVSATTI